MNLNLNESAFFLVVNYIFENGLVHWIDQICIALKFHGKPAPHVVKIWTKWRYITTKTMMLDHDLRN